MSQYIDSIAGSGDDNLLTVWGTMVNTRDIGAPAMAAPGNTSETTDNKIMLYLAAAGVVIAAVALLKKGR